MKRVRITGMGHLVPAAAVITGVWTLSVLLTSSCSPTKNAVFHERMSKFVPEFDRLNMEVLSQIPVYPEAQQVRIRVGGAHDPLTPTPRTLGVSYISDDPPSQIYEFVVSALLAQGWQVKEEELLRPYPIHIHFWKGYACIRVWAEFWDINSSTFTEYVPNSPDETPVSWYDLSIQHELDAVPGAPMPPEGQSLFECAPDTE